MRGKPVPGAPKFETDRNPGCEIEITPEMLVAGSQIICDAFDAVSIHGEWMAERIFCDDECSKTSLTTSWINRLKFSNPTESSDISMELYK